MEFDKSKFTYEREVNSKVRRYSLYGRIAMNFMHLGGELSAMAVLRGL